VYPGNLQLNVIFGFTYRFAIDRYEIYNRSTVCSKSTFVLMFHLSGNNRRDSHFTGY